MMLVNGQVAETVSARDRGLAYGDGVFRTLRCEAGRLWYWPRHYAKLAADCTALGLVCPTELQLLGDIAQLAPHDAVVKIMVTRGESGRGYACNAAAPATRIVQTSPLPVYAESLFQAGATVRRCDWLLSMQPGLAGIKHLNRLDQVMARREWDDVAIFDGLMLNQRGEVVEGVISNLFLLSGGKLHTHPLLDCGVAGVSREALLALAPQSGWQVDLVPSGWEDVMAADEVFLANSLAGIVPVGRLGDRVWSRFTECLQLRGVWLARAQKESRSWSEV